MALNKGHFLLIPGVPYSWGFTVRTSEISSVLIFYFLTLTSSIWIPRYP